MKMSKMWRLCSIYLVLLYNLSVALCNLDSVRVPDVSSVNEIEDRTFAIDYNRSTFLMNGSPFQYVSGSMHYFRTPHEYWRDRLRALRAAGLNAVDTYVEWSFHEPVKGQYRWSGDYNLVKYIELAQDEGLYVILRPGPYICAERDMGGFPHWLLYYYPNIKLRTNDADYKREVSRWYSELMSRIQPFLYGRGGPIIMVQVENEYGSFSACDMNYMTWLTNLTRSWVKDDAVLFTTDGSSVKLLACGSNPDAYATVDFGSGENVTKAWNTMSVYSGNGPRVNSEYYPGWLTHWGEPIARVNSKNVVRTLNTMLAMKGNVNFYMFHGGTNFDYTAGSNFGTTFTPDLTSYDYDAPLNEAGDPTEKYFSIRDCVLKYFPTPNVQPPAVKAKWSSDQLILEPVVHLLSAEGRARFGRRSDWQYPPTMEAVNQRSGLILYETLLNIPRADTSVLNVMGLNDRALVYISDIFAGVLSRTKKLYSMPILTDQGNILQILIENQGRINYGPIVNDFKGITRNVTVDNYILRQWTVTSFPLETIENDLHKTLNETNEFKTQARQLYTSTSGFLREGPVIYTVRFQVNSGDLLDSYLDVTGWGKGFAWVNDRHLGRYWPKEGPQVTLYTPGVYLNKYPAWNTLNILELQATPASRIIRFVNRPIGV